MADESKLEPHIEDTLNNVTSNEFTTYDFMTTFARFHEKEFVTALHESINHPAGPFGAVKEQLEKLLEKSVVAKKLRDGARGIDMLGLPGTTILWQRKKKEE